MQITYKIAHAAWTAAGNRSMRAAGRTAWSFKDREIAADTMRELLAKADSLVWSTDGSDRRTMVGRGNGRTYLVSRVLRKGRSGYLGFREGDKDRGWMGTAWPWIRILDNGELFKLRRDAMAACERHARGEG